MSRPHTESHLVERIGWLRAAVLGANDGIISTASLILGVASAAASSADILLTGVAGLVAGAMSMAAGEYVSVSSQADTEHADLAREKRELADDPGFETEELAQLYVARGVEVGLAREVAKQLMAKDDLPPTPVTNSASHRSAPPVRFKRHSHRPRITRLRRRSSCACPCLAIQCVDPGCRCGIAAFSGHSRCGWRKSRRRWFIEAHDPGDVLGCICDGLDGRYRRSVRKGGLAEFRTYFFR